MHTTSLPTGTVTFLFTDIEGSVNLWEEHPAAMRAALARHDDLLRHAIESHGGHVFKTVGDAFYAAFTTAPDAIVAALDAQRSLHAEIWNETGPVRVRMALHTGTAEVRGGDYFGPHLNRVARLLDAGHGGQVLLSLATEELARDQLLEGASLPARGVRGRGLLRQPGADYRFQPRPIHDRPATRDPGCGRPTPDGDAAGYPPAQTAPAASGQRRAGTAGGATRGGAVGKLPAPEGAGDEPGGAAPAGGEGAG